MSICKKCGENFPTWIVIENKKRNLQNRFYCLKCSPFKLHNTKQLHIEEREKIPGQGKEAKCKYCGKEYLYKRECGGSTTVCSSCYITKRRWKVKYKLVLDKGGKCENCGYNKCVAALSFHHIDKSTKEFLISACLSGRSKGDLSKEIDKCRLLCSNCHMELHYKAAENKWLNS